MEQLSIQSLGFLSGFQEDIKIPRPHGTINHTVIRVSYRVSRRYQNNDNNQSIIIIIVIVIIIVILACPDARCESGQTSGSCRITGYCTMWYLYILITHTYIYDIYDIWVKLQYDLDFAHEQLVNTLPQSRFCVPEVDEFYRNQFETKTSCGVAALGSWGYSPNSHFIYLNGTLPIKQPLGVY